MTQLVRKIVPAILACHIIGIHLKIASPPAGVDAFVVAVSVAGSLAVGSASACALAGAAPTGQRSAGRPPYFAADNVRANVFAHRGCVY